MAIEILVNYFVEIISSIGLLGIFFLMLLESTAAPVPSEAVMPFAGFLIAQGQLDFAIVLFVSTLGSLAGSLISYYIGYFEGKPAVLRFGKYFFLNVHHLEATEKFFARYGSIAVFVSRFVPIVRHLISIPAGIGRMQKRKFITLTILGALLWNGFLTWVGIILQSNWQEVLRYSQLLDIVMIAAIVILLVWFVRKFRRMKGAYSATAAKEAS